MAVMCRFLLLILLLLPGARFLSSADDEQQGGGGGGGSKEDEKYLYHGNNGLSDPYPVQDYRIAPGADAEYARLAPFIYDPRAPARVVEFYAPWCPHCQHFREHYIQFANQITTVAKENGFEVSVHAVSCEVHRSLCHDFGVHGYPKIMLFKAGEKNYTKEVPYYSIHPFQVLNDLGAHVDSLRLEQKDAAAPGGDGKGKKKVKQSTAEKGGDLEGGDAVTKKGQPRTKVDVFDDAYLSLVFALKNGVYMTNGPLSSNTTVKALKDWIDLLQVALPPAWNVQRMVAALKHDFDKIIQSEDQLVEVVDKFPPPSKTWSASCTHGEAGMGYTCGLWQLFHIVTVGVVEWNLMIATDDSVEELAQRTDQAALTIRNFIENFFGCEVCRLNFVQAYDSCSHDRCHRLKPESTSLEDWAQLPVWLWESHNSVNVRLLREKYERDDMGVPTHEDEINKMWPLRKDCPRCWDINGGFNDVTIYKYLRTEYWPEDFVTTEYREEIFGKPKASSGGGDDDDLDGSFLVLPSSLVLVLSIAFIVSMGAAWYFKRVKLIRSGYHKKNDAFLPYSNGV